MIDDSRKYFALILLVTIGEEIPLGGKWTGNPKLWVLFERITPRNISIILNAELSKRIKKDQSTVHRWINGSRGLTLDNLELLCGAIDISIKNIINPNLKIEVKKQLIVITDEQ